jgi:hypothetical protein
VRNGFALALGHQPSDAEVNVLVGLYEKVNGGGVMKKVNQSAKNENEAMTLVASAILNLDEFITKK